MTATTAPSPRRAARWLWGHIAAQRTALTLSLVTGALGGVFAAAEPFLVGVVVDHLRDGVSIAVVRTDVLLLVVFAALELLALLGQRYFSGQVAFQVDYHVRQDLFGALLAREHRFFQQNPTGDLMSRLSSDVDVIRRMLALSTTRLGSAVSTLVVAFVLLASIDARLALLVFVVLAVSTATQLAFSRALVPAFENVQDQAGALSAFVQDSVTGVQTIKTFDREADIARRYTQQNEAYRASWLRFKRLWEPIGQLPSAISDFTAGLVVVLGGLLAVRGQISLGNFTQFLLYLGLIGTVLLQIATVYQRVQQVRGVLRRFDPLLDTPTVADVPGARALPHPRGDVAFEDVSYDVDGVRLLHNITLRVPAGTAVGIIGPTGCGKSLLMGLLARAADVTHGRVTLDGHDVRALRLNDVRRAMAFVPQAPFLFGQTLRANIALAHPDLPTRALDEAVHVSRVSNDLAQLPHGLDTLVGEKGVMLSGGQKQRATIARAVARRPAVLVLDDALSSVDTRTAADILAALRGVLKARTSFIIAHRVATVKDADLIVVMDEGRIVEQGTHATLIAQPDSAYAQMAAREAHITSTSAAPEPD